MLKLSFHLRSNILTKNTNARLFRFYRRLSFFIYLFFYNKCKLSNKNITYSIQYARKKFSNKHTLMRSPFHYKTSKTLLSAPSQKSVINFSIPIKNTTPLVLSDCNNLFTYLNKSQNLCITKIKISSN